MSWESQQRCRFYPHCFMHNGDPIPRLSEANVEEIRDLYFQEGASIPYLAQTFAAGEKTIERILTGKTYRVEP